MSEVVSKEVEVRPRLCRPHRLTEAGGVRESFVADGDPQPMQHPAKATVTVELTIVGLVAQRSNFGKHAVEFE